jgi:hypothetical protein
MSYVNIVEHSLLIRSNTKFCFKRLEILRIAIFIHVSLQDNKYL